MMYAYALAAVAATFLALGMAMVCLPEKFLARGGEDGLPSIADRNWFFRTESRVRLMGFFYLFLGGMLLLALGTR
jgi:hypothetical protein